MQPPGAVAGQCGKKHIHTLRRAEEIVEYNICIALTFQLAHRLAYIGHIFVRRHAAALKCFGADTVRAGQRLAEPLPAVINTLREKGAL